MSGFLRNIRAPSRERLLSLLKSRWAIAAGAALLLYTLVGFLVVPWAVERFAPSIASEKLQRPVALGKVRFNPWLLKLEVEDFSLREPEGEPIVSLGRLFADVEVKGLFRRALAFRRIRLERPYVHAVMGSDGRLNLARLGDAFPPSEEPEPAHDEGLPRLVIDRFVLVDGAIEYTDRTKAQPVSERLDSLDLRVDAISTLPDNQASHHITAAFDDGSALDWRGHLSLEPLSSEGDLRLEGFKLATPWPFIKDRLALERPEGQLSVGAHYRFNQSIERTELTLSEIGLDLAGLRLVPKGGKQPLLELQSVKAGHCSFDLNEQSLAIPEWTVGPGAVRSTIAPDGTLDWQQVASSGASNPSPAASAPPPAEPAKPWRIAIESFKLADLALQLTDNSRQLPVDVSVGSFGLGFTANVEAGVGDPKVSVGKLASEIRKLVVKPLDAKDAMLGLETVRLGDGAVDLATRTVTLPVFAIEKGWVRAEVNETGAMNWERIGAPRAGTADSAAKPDRKAAKTAPAAKSPAAGAPWKVKLDQVKLGQVGLHYSDDSRRSPIEADIADIGFAFGAEVEAGVGDPKVKLDGLQTSVKQIVLKEQRRQHKPLARLAVLSLRDGRIDLSKNEIGIRQIELEGGETAVERNEKGDLHLAEVFAPNDKGKLATAAIEVTHEARAKGMPWKLTVEETSLKGFNATVSDRSVAPPFDLAVANAGFTIKNLSSDGKSPMAFNGGLHILPGGDLALQGTAMPSGDRAQAEVRLDRFDLTKLQPYVAQVGALKLESGNLSSRLKVGFQQKTGKTSVTAKGEVNSANLLLKEAKTGKRFAAWDKLNVEGIDFSLAPDKLAIREIQAIKPGANIEIFEDRTTNIDAIFTTNARQKSTDPRHPEPPKRTTGKSFPVTVERVKVDSAIVDFSDQSLILPFKTRIQNFGGTISGISTSPASRTLIKLDGRVDEYGEANLEGTLDLMQHAAFSDVTLIFRNVDMSSLSPYSGTFAGRRIQAGKLNAELVYRIENSRLNSRGTVELDQMALGTEVVSPRAASLPLDLAVALLTDNTGKIKVSVPIEGDVNSPQFSYGTVIWNAIANLITKVVTSPFTALASVFGDGESDMGEIFFIPGKSGLPPAEIEKLKKLATGLASRPQIIVEVKGTFDPKLDAEALKSWELRNDVSERLGIAVEPGEDPGPLAFDSAKTQKALEDLADERGKDALTSSLSAFRQKNGREPKRIGAVAAMLDRASEDAQFYQVLFERLVATAPLAPRALESLAERRTAAIIKELATNKGMVRNRVRAAIVESVGDREGRIPTRLDLKTGGS